MTEIKILQKAYLEKVKKQINKDTLLAKEMAKILNISTSEAYSKISGSSMLSLAQIHLLSSTFNIPFYILGSEANATVVEFIPFYQQNIAVDKYLAFLKNFLDDAHKLKEKKILCATEDIPIFNLFKYPELAAFKLYYWYRRNQINNHSATMPIFNIDTISQEKVKAAYQLYELYKQIPHVEIWSRGSLYNTVEQIRYASESGIIKDKNLGKLIVKQLSNVLDDVTNSAIQENHNLNSNASFEWYFCEIIGNETYLAQLEQKQLAFIRFNTFNNLKSDNEYLCSEIKHWMNALIYDGTSFNGQSSKHRNIFLQEAYKVCDELIEQFQ